MKREKIGDSRIACVMFRPLGGWMPGDWMWTGLLLLGQVKVLLMASVPPGVGVFA